MKAPTKKKAMPKGKGAKKPNPFTAKADKADKVQDAKMGKKMGKGY